MFGDHYGAASAAQHPTAFSHQGGHSVSTELLSGSAVLKAGLTQFLTGTRFTVGRIGRTETLSPSPALYIVDASGPFQQTLEWVQSIKNQHPEAKIVALADNFEP